MLCLTSFSHDMISFSDFLHWFSSSFYHNSQRLKRNFFMTASAKSFPFGSEDAPIPIPQPPASKSDISFSKIFCHHALADKQGEVCSTSVPLLFLLHIFLWKRNSRGKIICRKNPPSESSLTGEIVSENLRLSNCGQYFFV